MNAHGAFDLANVLGVVERAWIGQGGDGFEGRAVVRFSEREDVEPFWQDVRAGIIRSVSVGYQVRTYEVSEQDGQPPLWRAIDWVPLELSAVRSAPIRPPAFAPARPWHPAISFTGRPPPSNRRPQSWTRRPRRPTSAPTPTAIRRS